METRNCPREGLEGGGQAGRGAMDVDSWTDSGAFRDGHPEIEEDSIQHLFFLTSMTYLLSIPFTIMTCLKLMGELDAAWKLVFIPVWIWMLPLPIIVFFELYFIDIPDPVHNAGNILFRVMRSRLSVRRFYLRRMRTLLWTVVQLVSTWVGLVSASAQWPATPPVSALSPDLTAVPLRIGRLPSLAAAADHPATSLRRCHRLVLVRDVGPALRRALRPEPRDSE